MMTRGLSDRPLDPFGFDLKVADKKRRGLSDRPLNPFGFDLKVVDKKRRGLSYPPNKGATGAFALALLRLRLEVGSV